MKEAVLFDGEVLEFPDETPDDVIDYRVKVETANKKGIAPEDQAEPGQVPGHGFTVPESIKPKPPEPTGMVDTIMNDYLPAASAAAEPTLRVGGFGVKGAGFGAANILGLPVDLVNASPMLLNLLPGDQGFGPISDYPLLGSAMNRDIYKGTVDTTADLFGAPKIDWHPDTRAERVAERIGEEVGATAVPMGGALAKGARVGVEGAREMSVPVVKQMVESAAANPRKFVQKELYAGGAAGTGAAAANEVTSGAGYQKGGRVSTVADLFGALLGAGAGALASSGFGGLTRLVQAASRNPGYVDQLVKEVVTDRIINASTNAKKTPQGVPDTTELVNTINQGPRVSDDIPGVIESLSDRTGDPGIANLEYGRQSGPNAGMFNQRRNENMAAINTALEGVKPEGTAAELATQLLGERARRQSTLAQTEQTAQQAAGASERAIEPRMIAQERGTEIRGALETARDASADEVRQAWEPINQSLEQVDLTPLAETFQQGTEALSRAEQRRFVPPEANIPEQLSQVEPPQPSGLLDAQGNPLPPTPAPPPLHSINEVTGLRSALTTAIAEAMDKPGGANEARILRGYVDRIDQFLDTNIPANLRQQYDQARQLRVAHGDRFEQPQTAVAQTLAEKRGQPAMDPSVVPRKFVQPENGRVSDFQHLMQEAGSDPRAINAVRDQLRQLIKERGLLRNPAEIDSFLQQYDTVLQRFPDVRTELQGAGQQRVAASSAEADRIAFEKEHGTQGTSGTSAPGKFMAFSPDQAKQAMRQVIGSKDPGKAADELLKFANDTPEAVQGARKAFWDVMEADTRSKGATTGNAATGETPWLKARLREFLKEPKNKAVMDRLWRDHPEQLENLEIIVKAMQGLDTRLSAKAPNSSGTPQGVLPSAETAQSRLLAWQRGQVGTTWIITSLGTMVGRRLIKGAQRDAIERLTDEALLNPDKAALLMAENNPANREALRRWAKGYLGAETSNVINMLSGEEEDDEHKKAIIGEGGGKKDEATDLNVKVGVEP